MISFLGFFKNVFPKGALFQRLLLLFILSAVCLFLNATCFYYFESPSNPQLTYFDSIWVSVVTMTTVGYGDFYAKTIGGRLSTIIFAMILGIGLVAGVVSTIAEIIMDLRLRRIRGMSYNKKDGAIVVFNAPSIRMVLNLIKELKADPLFSAASVCLIESRFDELPFELRDKVDCYIKSPAIGKDTLDRSNVKSAKCIVILPRDLNDAESDATSHTLASLISRLIDPSKTRLVVRLVSEENCWMFEDHVSVVTGEIADLLLVQEAADPGVSKSIRKLLMNTEDCDPMVFKIEKFHGKSWGDLINACLLRNMGKPVNKLVYPLALNTNWSQPIEQVLRIGDSVMVASSENHNWKAFEEELLKHAPRNFDTVLNQFLQ